MKELFLFISLTPCILGVFYSIAILIRSELVYRFRLKILHQNYSLYRELPSYDSMVYDWKPLKLENYIKLPKDIFKDEK